MRLTIYKRRFSLLTFVAGFSLVSLLLYSVLFLIENRQVARNTDDNILKPTKINAPLPNLSGDEAKEYLREQGLYSSLAEAMQAARYSINPTKNAPLPKKKEAFQANNPRQGFTTYFANDGIHLVSKAKDDKWRIGLNLTGYGYGESLIAVEQTAMEVQKDKSRIEIAKSQIRNPKSQIGTITEWYENSPNGLEQGWTIAERLPNEDLNADLKLVLKLSGDLKAKLAEDNQSINFSKENGEAVLLYDKLKSWDADGKELASRMELEKGELSIMVDDREAKYPITIDPFFTQTKKLTASDAAAGDEFGVSVAISGDRAIVGAYQDADGGTDSGSAYIFERNSNGMGGISANNWGEVKKLVASDATSFDQFGWSVGISGDTAIVGAHFDDDAGNFAGSAYIFERNSGGADNWGQIKKLISSAPGDQFGKSVSISGDTAIVGAPLNDVVPSDSGSAHIFERNSDGMGGTSANFWGEIKKLTASDAAAIDQFGRTVAISGDTAIVGASGDESFTGSAYVFERNTGGANTWGEVKKLTASDAAVGDQFGESVAMSGGTAVVGAYLNDDSGSQSGSAYVFERNTGGVNNWGEVKKLTASDAGSSDEFGRAVSISNDTVIVGAHQNDDAGINSGSAYIYERNMGGVDNWGQVQELASADAAAGDHFGYSVSISAGTAIVGAWGDDIITLPPLTEGNLGATNINQGSAYVFTNQDNTWQQASKSLSADGTANDEFGISVSVSGSTAIVGAPRNDDSGSNSGSAYIFERNQGGADNWGQVKKLLASDGAGDDDFGWSVGVSGDTVIVGAFLDDDSGAESGSAYIFERNSGGANNWGQVKKLTASDAAMRDYFGSSVGISGDTAIISGRSNDDGGTDSGSAYIFERNNGGANNWGEVKKLTASDAAAGDQFGYSVAISGDSAVVGAWLNDDGGPSNGSAYIFKRNTGGADNWGEVKKLTASDAFGGDRFGCSVAIFENTTIIGACFDNGASGSAYIFKRNTGSADNWGEVKKLTASDGAVGDQFGYSVTISADTAVVGAPFDDDGGATSGSAYIFQRNQGGADNWGELTKMTASDAAAGDQFGQSVSISDDFAIVGAIFADISSLNGPVGKDRFGQKSFLNKTNSPDLAGANQGAAYVFNAAAAPTAASATVAGRVTTTTGRGIPRVAVSITDLDGNIRFTRTNHFGYFNFTGIGVGATYIIGVSSKPHQFSPSSQAITVSDDVKGIQFIGFER